MRILLLLILLCSTCAHGQERIVGLAEIPALPAFESLDANQPGVAVRAEPSAASAAIAELRSFDAIEFREHGYEERSAAVYKAEIIDDDWWYQVRLTSPSRVGWIAGEAAGPVRWVEDLLQDRMTYLTGSWDKKLRLAAGKPDTEFRVPLESREAAMHIAEKTRVDGELWLLVVVTESPCEGGDPAVLSAGWLPLYAADDSLNVWFYSRGC